MKAENAFCVRKKDIKRATKQREKKELHISAEEKEFHCTAYSADDELLDIMV